MARKIKIRQSRQRKSKQRKSRQSRQRKTRTYKGGSNSITEINLEIARKVANHFYERDTKNELNDVQLLRIVNNLKMFVTPKQLEEDTQLDLSEFKEKYSGIFDHLRSQ